MNKAFVRSVEAVMAILLFFSFYSIKTQTYESESITYNPSRQIIGLMESLESNNVLSSYVQSYDLKGLSEIFSYFLPPLSGFKIESSCLEIIDVKNNNNFLINANMSFLKFFPKTANINSIDVLDSSNNFMPVSIKNNFYITDFSIITTDALVYQILNFDNIRITVDESESINESSMYFFINNEPAIISLESINYNIEPYDANISIKVLISYLKENSVAKGALFYATNETNFIHTYPELGSGITAEYYFYPSQKSKACEIIFSDLLAANTEKKYGLYYEINTNTQKQYNNLLANDSNIDIFVENTYYDADESLKDYEAESYYSIKSSYVLSKRNCMINLKVWNYE
ncbi:MAG: hypothetical protein PHN56_06085 [Candidatus Nanoarchaeia archaeon]|nr:hypothetical protein [Candidatus Nanoarchaeia archaeon]